MESEAVKRVEWRRYRFNANKGNLLVEFRNGTYVYFGLSRQRYQAFMAAESKGRYVNEKIKGRYQFSRMSPRFE